MILIPPPYKVTSEMLELISKIEANLIYLSSLSLPDAIKDQRIVSFNQIQRRFMQVPKRTLSFDLKKLMDKELVVKIGKTKGSYYQLKK